MAELSMEKLFGLQTKINKLEIEGQKEKGDEKPPIIGVVYVREFTSKDRRDVFAAIGGDETRIPASYIIFGVCDKDGKRKFVETDEMSLDDLINKISEMPDMVVAQMLAAVMKANSHNEKEAAKN